MEKSATRVRLHPFLSCPSLTLRLALQAQYETAFYHFQDENASLRKQLLNVNPDSARPAPCTHAKEIHDLVQRLAAAQASLRQVTAEKNALRKQLGAEETARGTQQVAQSRKHTQQQASFVEALEKFKQQLVEQQDAHLMQQNVLSERIAIGKADKAKIKVSRSLLL